MVKIGLQFKATTEGITNLKASGEDFRWYLKVWCKPESGVSMMVLYS
jgi:hypothetical protein